VFESVEADISARIATSVRANPDADPLAVMRRGTRTWLDSCAEPEIHRIVLLDAPAVLGWERWTEIGNRHNMGLVSALLSHAMDVGRIPKQPVPPLAHTLLGAMREAALYLSRADNRKRARREVGAVVDRLIGGLAAP